MSVDSLERLPGKIALWREKLAAFLYLRSTFGKETTFFCPLLWKVGGGRKCWLICQPDFEINTCWHFPFSPGKIASVVCRETLGWCLEWTISFNLTFLWLLLCLDNDIVVKYLIINYAFALFQKNLKLSENNLCDKKGDYGKLLLLLLLLFSLNICVNFRNSTSYIYDNDILSVTYLFKGVQILFMAILFDNL